MSLNAYKNNPLVAKLAQVVTASTVAVGSTATVIPKDDTIPQITEGAEILTVAITPINASSTIRITAFVPLCQNSANCILALFVDATSDALAVSYIQDASDGRMATLIFETSAGSLASRTYRLRGGSSTGTFYWNQISTGRLFGGVLKTELIVEEILP